MLKPCRMPCLTWRQKAPRGMQTDADSEQCTRTAQAHLECRLPQSTLRNYRNSVDRVSRQLLPVKTSLLVQALSRSAAAALERSSGSPHAPRETASTSAHQQQCARTALHVALTHAGTADVADTCREQPAQQLRQRGMPALGPPSSKTAGHLQRHSDLQVCLML